MRIVQNVLLSLLLTLSLFVPSDANNYDAYLEQLAADSQLVHDQFLRENPRAQYILDQFNSNAYRKGNPILDGSLGSSETIEDSQWRTFLADLDKARRLAAQNSEEKEDFISSFPTTGVYQAHSTLPELDTLDGFKRPEIASRRLEVAPQNPLWGEHKVSGGSSETGRWLDYALVGAEQQDDQEETSDNDPLMNYLYPNAIAQMNSAKAFKNSSLPAYCDPPNPCPIGYDPDRLPTPCDPTTKYTMELNRELILNKVASGECTCDVEHMNSCSFEPDHGFSYVRRTEWPEMTISENPYLRGERRKRLVAKKSFRPKSLKRHWYQQGQILKAVVKKAGPYVANA